MKSLVRLGLVIVPALAIIAFVFLRAPAPSLTHADATHNLEGWVWNGEDGDGDGVVDGGFGWISFNCTNDPFSCADTNYGVHININTGVLSGFAWGGIGDPGPSPAGIGWVDFNPSVGCPLAPCEGRVDKTTGVVTGWARALSFDVDGGWDGWISLNCSSAPGGCASSNYGVTLEILTVPGGRMTGFAWGGNDTDGNGSTDGGLGWIEFDVTFNDVFNHPPVAVDDALGANESIVTPSTDLNVLANDSDPDGDPITIVSTTQPANGSVDIINGGTMLRYTPNPGLTSPPSEEFTYTITDPKGATATANVTVFVYDCGDGIQQLAEQCDGDDFGPSTCQSQGLFVGGPLICTPLCTIDTAQCIRRPRFDFEEF